MKAAGDPSYPKLGESPSGEAVDLWQTSDLTGLPDGITAASFGPDGRLWLTQTLVQPESIPFDIDSAIGELKAVYADPRPHLRHSRVALFGPGEWVWVATDRDRLLLGYNGRRIERQHAMASKRRPREFVGVPPADVSRGHGHAVNRAFDGSAFFVDRLGVHRFDGSTWTYRQLAPDHQIINWRSVVLMPVGPKPPHTPDPELRAAAWFTGEEPEALHFYRLDGWRWEEMEFPPALVDALGDRGPDLLPRDVAATAEAFWMTDEDGQLYRLPVDREGRIAEGITDWKELRVSRFAGYSFARANSIRHAADGRAVLHADVIRQTDAFRGVSGFLFVDNGLVRGANLYHGNPLRTVPTAEVLNRPQAPTLHPVGPDRVWLADPLRQKAQLLDPRYATVVLEEADLRSEERLMTTGPDGGAVVFRRDHRYGWPFRSVDRLIHPSEPRPTPALRPAEHAGFISSESQPVKLAPDGTPWTRSPLHGWQQLGPDGWQTPRWETLSSKTKAGPDQPGWHDNTDPNALPTHSRNFWPGNDGAAVDLYHASRGATLVTPDGQIFRAEDLKQLIHQQPDELKRFFAGSFLPGFHIGANGWVWRLAAPDDDEDENRPHNVLGGLQLHRGAGDRWHDIGPAVARAVPDFKVNPYAITISPVGDGDTLAVFPDRRGHRAVVIRIASEAVGETPRPVVEVIEGIGRFGMHEQPLVYGPDGSLLLAGYDPQSRQRPTEEQPIRGWYVLQIHPDGTTTRRPAPGRLVFLGGSGVALYTDIPGRTVGWHAVIENDQPPDYFLLPGSTDQMVYAQDGDGRIWISHGGLISPLEAPTDPSSTWTVGRPLQPTGVRGNLDRVWWSPQGFFVLHYNAFGNYHPGPPSHEPDPPYVAVFRPADLTPQD